MRQTTERELGLVLADLVSLVLRSPLDVNSTEDMAAKCGYSRFHLTRVFLELTGEPPIGFLRRIRLERAACRLRSGESVSEAASAAGFHSHEAFSRSFKRAYGLSPRLYTRFDKGWQLESPEGLHWNEHWDETSDNGPLRTRYGTVMGRSPTLRLAVMRHVGNYGSLYQGWERVPYLEGREWVTIYLDNMWTCPRRDLMRSELGFKLPLGGPPPGFRVLEIPGGLTVRTSNFLERKERNDAWSYLSGSWPNLQWGWDEYAAWPLPFEDVRTRMCLRIGE